MIGKHVFSPLGIWASGEGSLEYIARWGWKQDFERRTKSCKKKKWGLEP